ncbi:pyridoxine biosynthesis protein [Microbotryomycetes sp. JL221]|nr:pyridoxine biosynthesis protein [Microbotryomycetes sp. JL221]
MLGAARHVVRASSTSFARQFHTTYQRLAITEFQMPAMSPTMTEGGISSWQVKEGDKFSAGDVILQISTDKAEIDVEAQDDGVMGKILVKEGTQSVQVGQVIAMLAEEGDDLASIKAPTSESKPATTSASDKSSQQPKQETSTSSSSSSKPTTDAPKPTDSAAHGSKPSASHKHPHHSKPLLPSVMRLLVLNGIEDADVIKGTGFKGLLTKGDVLAHLGQIKTPRGSLPKEDSHAVADKPAPKQPEQPKLIELDGPTFRQLIASGLREPYKAPKPVVQEVPTPQFSGFDIIMDQYLPVSQRTTTKPKKNIPTFQSNTTKKDSFDELLDL